MTFLKKVTRFMTDFLPPRARNTNKTQPKLKKRRNFWILTFFTFCLIVSRVFVIETITGYQIKDFCVGVSNLGPDLRKTYPAECQTMVLSNFFNIERASRMSKKILYRSPPDYFWWQNIKFHNICNYQF